MLVPSHGRISSLKLIVKEYSPFVSILFSLIVTGNLIFNSTPNPIVAGVDVGSPNV